MIGESKIFKYEYSQSLLFEVETCTIIAHLKSIKDLRTEIEFVDKTIQEEFFKTCQSWDIYSKQRLYLKDDKLVIHLTYDGAIEAYQYSMFMSLLLSFLDGDFKMKKDKE